MTESTPKKSLALTLLLISASLNMQAQQPAGDTSLKSTTIEVIQSYKPEVKQVPKPEFVSELPPRDTSHPRINFDVPQQTLYFTYSSLPIRPLALGKDTIYNPFPSYIKAGGGNFSTLYFDAGVASLKGDNYETALHLHHLSQEGAIKNQKISLSGIEAEGRLRTESYDWHAGVEALRNQYHLYGYDHYLYDYSGKFLEQTYTGLEISADMKKAPGTGEDLTYHPSLTVWVYGRDFNADEKTFSFDVPFSKEMDSTVTVSLGLSGIITHNSFFGAKSYYNNIFQLKPRADFRSRGFMAHVALYPTLGKDGNTYLLPDIGLSYYQPRSRFTVSGGWSSVLRQNTYRQLTSYNPYLSFPYEARQTRTDEVYGLVQGSIGNHITLSGRLSWWEFRNMPLFLNDTGADHKDFYIIYDERIHAVSVQAGISYNVTNAFSIGATAVFFNYYKNSYDRVWHEPGIRLKGDMTLRPSAALTITAYLNVMDQIYVLDKLHNEKKLDAIFDLGGGAEYSFIPRLSVFLNVNNIFNDTYQRWYGYDTYGINILGGLRLKL